MDDGWRVSKWRSDSGLWSNPIRALALETAIAAVNQAIAIVGEALQSLGFDSQPSDCEGVSRYEAYCKHDQQLLEDCDSVYSGLTPEGRMLDDRDLSELESNFQFGEHSSPRMRALALRMVARDLIFVARGRSKKDLANALSRIVSDDSGCVDIARTYERYVPHCPVD